ncbi:MAG: hypothetical protein IJK97_14215, partial [Thermoguttaceae bacterium]|nr:hypothetical protein [Thermoguttaceae bacterium]
MNTAIKTSKKQKRVQKATFRRKISALELENSERFSMKSSAMEPGISKRLNPERRISPQGTPLSGRI